MEATPTSPADLKRPCSFCGREATLKYDSIRKYMRCICVCGAHLTSDVHTPWDVAGAHR